MLQVSEATPDNPVPTIMYPDEDSVHPNRKDFEEQRTIRARVSRVVEWVIKTNDTIRIPSTVWVILFILYYVGVLIITNWLALSLSIIYAQGNYTFDPTLTDGLLSILGFMVGVIFPAYVLYYGATVILSMILKWGAGRS